MTRLLLIAMIGLYSVPANARGDWTSSGGDVLLDANNPWFIQNTPEIRYCVVIDEENFGVSGIRVNQIVRDTFSFYRTQFSEMTSSDTVGFGKVILGSQKIIEQATCDETTDIVFQMGKLLSQEQVDYLKDPRRHIGVAVRTSYDEHSLKGRGFIFIGPEKGPSSFVSDRTCKTPWSGVDDNLMLERVILHEVGHIFGLKHARRWYEFMAEGYPEAAVTWGCRIPESFAFSGRPEISRFHWRSATLGSVCVSTPSGEGLGNTPMAKYFGVPKDWQCVKLVSDANKTLRAYGKVNQEDPDSAWHLTGQVQFGAASRKNQVGNIGLFITQQQTVFPGSVPLAGITMPGPTATQERYEADFIDAQTMARTPIILTVGPGMVLELAAIIGGHLVTVSDSGEW